MQPTKDGNGNDPPPSTSLYYVLDNDTLVVHSAGTHMLSVLATRSGFRQSGDMLVASYTDKSRLRTATVEDFDHFRVCHKGHLS
jgi:hypothetical protein